MRLLGIVIFSSILVFGTVACATVELKKELTTEAIKDNTPKTTLVCLDVQGKDGKFIKNKDGSVKQDCKTIKIHKKYDGTPLPSNTPVKKDNKK